MQQEQQIPAQAARPHPSLSAGRPVAVCFFYVALFSTSLLSIISSMVLVAIGLRQLHYLAIYAGVVVATLVTLMVLGCCAVYYSLGGPNTIWTCHVLYLVVFISESAVGPGYALIHQGASST